MVRVIEEHDLDDMGEQLERSWLGHEEPNRSLRDLADRFNQATLRKEMERAGMDPIDADVETSYDLLSGDVSSDDRIEIEIERAEDELASVEERIEDIEDRLDERERIAKRREETDERLTALRTRIETLETPGPRVL